MIKALAHAVDSASRIGRMDWSPAARAVWESMYADLAVITALQADPVALPAFTARAGHAITLRAVVAPSAARWRIEEAAHG